MADARYTLKLDAPWQEPTDLQDPTAEQWSGGVVVVHDRPCMSRRSSKHNSVPTNYAT